MPPRLERREAPPSPEVQMGELKRRETSRFEKILSKGKKWLGIVGLTLVSSALVEGAFSREARADEPAKPGTVDASLYKKVNLLAEQSGQPAPLELIKLAGQFTNLDSVEENLPEDKAAALINHGKQLSTPGTGFAHEVSPGVKVRGSYDSKSKDGAKYYALLTINGDFFLK